MLLVLFANMFMLDIYLTL